MKKCIIYNPYRNHTVADRYISFVEQCLNNCNVTTTRVDNITEAEKDTGAFVVSVNDVPKARKKGYYPVLLWTQGISPEESYMRNKSKLRSMVLSFIERRGLVNANAYLFVSESMRLHFNKKYHRNFDNYYVMPCFNEEIDEKSFFTPGKYTDNVFLYAGGLQVWQCFEETIKMYKKIEDKVENCSLRVLTKDQDKAKEIIGNCGVKKYSVGYVSPQDIGDELKKAKFGFSLREDTPVNRVATPTKLSTYVAYGVMPIYSRVIQGFDSFGHHSQFCIGLDDIDNSIDKVVRYCNEDIKPQDVLQSYKQVFSTYYSIDYHKDHLTSFLERLK